jgi:hypothetical protein
MNDALPTNRLSFRVHFIRIIGPEPDPTVRVLLVETSKAQTIYEGFGTWSQCRSAEALNGSIGESGQDGGQEFTDV